MATILLSGCGGGSPGGAVSCGAGTVEVNGSCVPQCGAGTVLVKGVCVVGATGGTGGATDATGGTGGVAGASGGGGSGTAGGPGAGTGGVAAGGGGASGTNGGGNSAIGGAAGAAGSVAICAPDGKPVADPLDDACSPKLTYGSVGDCMGICSNVPANQGCLDPALSCTNSGVNNAWPGQDGLSTAPHRIFRTPSHPGCIGACAPPMCPPAPGAKPIYTLRIDIDQGSEITSILYATFFVDAPWHAYFDYGQHIPNDSNSECGKSVANCTPFSVLPHNALYVWTDDPNAPARNVHVIGGCIKAAGCPGAKFSDIVAVCNAL